jgi:hypothetical protein
MLVDIDSDYIAPRQRVLDSRGSREVALRRGTLRKANVARQCQDQANWLYVVKI